MFLFMLYMPIGLQKMNIMRGWDSNPRIPKEQGCRKLPTHSNFALLETCAVDRAWRPPHYFNFIKAKFIYC